LDDLQRLGCSGITGAPLQHHQPISRKLAGKEGKFSLRIATQWSKDLEAVGRESPYGPERVRQGWIRGGLAIEWALEWHRTRGHNSGRWEIF
jgi:hypothetical protein